MKTDLLPFVYEGETAGLAVTGSVSRCSKVLLVDFRVSGAVNSVVWPSLCRAAGRRDALWHNTCFEVFFAHSGAAPYWEVNLSPSGCWNMYRFSGYRRDMEETGLKTAPCLQFLAEGSEVMLSATIDLAQFKTEGLPLDLGLSAILEFVHGRKSYWALCHLGQDPDFHIRQSFSLSL